MLQCVEWVAIGLHMGEIKTKGAEDWGVSRRTVEAYARRARARVAQALGKTREQHQGEGLAFYRMIIQDKQADVRDRLMARKRIDEMLGLDEPRRTELSGPNGTPLQHDHREVGDTLRNVMKDQAAADAMATLAEKMVEAAGQDDG